MTGNSASSTPPAEKAPLWTRVSLCEALCATVRGMDPETADLMATLVIADQAYEAMLTTTNVPQDRSALPQFRDELEEAWYYLRAFGWDVPIPFPPGVPRGARWT